MEHGLVLSDTKPLPEPMHICIGESGKSLVQILVCCPFGTKPLSKSMMSDCHLDSKGTAFIDIWIKIQIFYNIQWHLNQYTIILLEAKASEVWFNSFNSFHCHFSHIYRLRNNIEKIIDKTALTGIKCKHIHSFHFSHKYIHWTIPLEQYKGCQVQLLALYDYSLSLCNNVNNFQ